jgi:serine phosphatase RsbU (regulator of sigma subunit)
MKSLVIAVLFLGEIARAAGTDSTEKRIQDLLDRASSLHYSIPDSSFVLCCEAENIANEYKLIEKYGLSLLCKSRYFLLKSSLDEAGKAINDAIGLFNEHNFQLGLGHAYSLKNIFLKRIKKDDEALSFLEKANEIFRVNKDVNGQRKTFTNLALDYIDRGHFEKAENALNELWEIIKENQNRDHYYYHQNRGSLFQAKQQYLLALADYQKAFEIAVNLKMIDSQTTILNKIASVHGLLKNFKEAEIALQKSLKIAEDAGLSMEIMDAYEEFTNLYLLWGNYEKAFKTFKKQVEIRDTLYNLEKINRINDYEKKLALSEKERIITQQNLELELHTFKAKESQEKAEKMILLTLLIFTLSIGITVVYIRTRKLNKLISVQKKQVEEKHKDITDSIQYARLIQNALLKDLSNDEQKNYWEHFILYKPKDIVSGDFYWSCDKEDWIYLVVADCTGHGVPGAFMSMLGIAFLNEITSSTQLLSPAEILNQLRSKIIKELKHKGREGGANDGMDISIIKINKNTLEAEWAGANNPLLVLKKSISSSSEDMNVSEPLLIEYKADKQPIGFHIKTDSFTNHHLQFNKGDSLYLFSDGYADQFGGEKGKKYNYRQFKQLILSVQDKSMNNQQQIFHETFETWKGELEQVDDICVMGLRL